MILLRLYRAVIRSKMEYIAFLLHNVNKSQAQKLDRLQTQGPVRSAEVQKQYTDKCNLGGE